MNNEAIEDYLKTIFVIQKETGKVATTVLAKSLNIAPASATGMIKKLSDMKLVTYEPYQGVKLTDAGRRIALEVIRHHRLIELFLSESLGVPWDKVHDEAEKWEHILSEDMEDRIDKLLGFPKIDPHGAPIPDRNGEYISYEKTRLSELKTGTEAVISEVKDSDAEMLKYIGGLGLYPKTEISVVDVAPFDGPMNISIGNIQISIGRKVASHILVTEISSAK
jgi:DtxR family Mn-dependent transcriptional regulator